MAATKEAIMAKEHEHHLDIQVFMMDMRAFSKGYWSYYERARQHYGIKYTRCRISAIRQEPQTHNLIIEYQDESGNLCQEKFDMAVLSVGMEIPEATRQLGQRLGIELDQYGFCKTDQANPLETSRAGIFAVGPFREPKDIPESVIEASAAAAAVACQISPARFSQTSQIEYPTERDVSNDQPRVGVFVCHCGSNIGGYLDVPDVSQYASSLPNVVHAENNLYTCSQDSIKHITEQIKEHNLNRVVVASCTPRTHEPLFQDSLRMAGLNPFLFEMANIRNHCSWVHSDDNPAATQKARDLVRMAVARASLLAPLHTIEIPVQHAALVVGGGAAGMTAALTLADQGFPVHLVEKDNQLGGNLRFTRVTLPESTNIHPIAVQEILSQLISRTLAHPGIIVHLQSEIVSSRGFMGNFTSSVIHPGGATTEITHGTTILAIGGQEYRGPEYGYGTDPRILTQQQFEALLTDPTTPDLKQSAPDSVAMLLCVGPAEKYCSRICCTVAIKNALLVKQRNPKSQVVILYKDIRTYGFKEQLYTRARQQGILFIRYDDEHPPQVLAATNEPLSIRAWDPNLHRMLELNPELLVLSMPVIPQPDIHKFSAKFKVSVDTDGFLFEAHVKLRPVDFANDGIFMAGLAHYPKLLPESIIQAQAAASRAARILSRSTLTAGGSVAVVDQTKCTGCLTCVRICPFNVPKIQSNLLGIGNIHGAAYIEIAVCQGCGICVAECPARAIQLMHYTDSQLNAKLAALVNPSLAFIPLTALVQVDD